MASFSVCMASPSISSKFCGVRKPLAAAGRATPRSSTNFRVSAYQITFKGPYGERTVECPPEKFMLDVALEQGLPLPFSCRAGACSSCLGVLEKGAVDQSKQTFLTGPQEDAGWVLTCYASPSSDCVIVTDKESEFYA